MPTTATLRGIREVLAVMNLTVHQMRSDRARGLRSSAPALCICDRRRPNMTPRQNRGSGSPDPGRSPPWTPRFTAEQDEIRRTLRELLHKRCGPEDVQAAVGTPAGYDPRPVDGPRAAARPARPRPPRGVRRCRLLGHRTRPGLRGVGPRPRPLAAPGHRRARRPARPRPRHRGPARRTAAPHRLRRPDRRPRRTRRRARHRARPDRRQPRRLGGRRPRGRRPGQAGRDDGGWRLYGQAGQVLDGHSAGLLVVAAHTGGFARSRTLLFLVRRRTRTGLVTGPADVARRDAPPGPGRTTGRGRPSCSDRRGRPMWPAPSPPSGDTAATVLAAEAVGAADRALERTVEYVRQREQFGRAIGSFQAVKHRLADVYVQVQAARSAAYYAAWAAGYRGAGASGSGGLALAQALEALRTAASEADPAARRHRLHLGARRPPVLQARGRRRAALRAGPPAAGARAAESARALRPAPRRRRLMATIPEPGWCRRSPRPGLRPRRPALHPRAGPRRAPADPRKGAAQRPDAAGGHPDRARRQERAGSGVRRSPACPRARRRRRGGGGELDPHRLQLRPRRITPPGPPISCAHPDAEISWKGEDIPVTARLLDGEERDAAWKAVLAFWPPYATYQARVDREIRLFRIVRR